MKQQQDQQPQASPAQLFELIGRQYVESMYLRGQIAALAKQAAEQARQLEIVQGALAAARGDTGKEANE